MLIYLADGGDYNIVRDGSAQIGALLSYDYIGNVGQMYVKYTVL